VNLHPYLYAGIGPRSDSELQANNPVKYEDPDGKEDDMELLLFLEKEFIGILKPIN